MPRIVAIGGGELPGPGCVMDTTELDAEVVRLADTRSPRLVFLPTATGDEPGYIAKIREHYGRRLGCRVEPLPLYDRSRTAAEIGRALAAADIVYVGGGNTLRMMKRWRRRGVDRLLSPHHDSDPRRQVGLRRLARANRRTGLGLDDCAALEVVGDRFRILACRTGACGHRVDRAGVETDLPAHENLRSLAGLTSPDAGDLGPVGGIR